MGDTTNGKDSVPSSIEHLPTAQGLWQQLHSLLGDSNAKLADSAQTSGPGDPGTKGPDEPYAGFNKLEEAKRRLGVEHEKEGWNNAVLVGDVVVGTPLSAAGGGATARATFEEANQLRALAQQRTILRGADNADALAAVVREQQALRGAIRFRGMASAAGSYIAAVGIDYIGDKFIFKDDQKQEGTLVADMLASPAIVGLTPGPWYVRAAAAVGAHYLGRLYDHYHQPEYTYNPEDERHKVDAKRQHDQSKPAPGEQASGQAGSDATPMHKAPPSNDGTPSFIVAPPPDAGPTAQPAGSSNPAIFNPGQFNSSVFDHTNAPKTPADSSTAPGTGIGNGQIHNGLFADLLTPGTSGQAQPGNSAISASPWRPNTVIAPVAPNGQPAPPGYYPNAGGAIGADGTTVQTPTPGRPGYLPGRPRNPNGMTPDQINAYRQRMYQLRQQQLQQQSQNQVLLPVQPTPYSAPPPAPYTGTLNPGWGSTRIQ